MIRENTTEKGKPYSEKRGKVRGLSKQSLKRLAFMVSTSQVSFTSIITLTYGIPAPTTGNTTKKHLKYFLQDMYRRLGTFSYCWWLEFQTKTQNPHYHLLTTLPGPTPLDRRIMAEIWVEAIYRKTKGYTDEAEKVFKVHSFTPYKGSKKRAAWEAVREIEGAKKYIIKYASKHEQKEVPNTFSKPGRFWGTSSDVSNKDYQESEATEEEIRDYLSKLGLSVANSLILPKEIIIPK